MIVRKQGKKETVNMDGFINYVLVNSTKTEPFIINTKLRDVCGLIVLGTYSTKEQAEEVFEALDDAIAFSNARYLMPSDETEGM